MKNTEILVKSKLSYEKNMIIKDNDSKEVFKVVACKKLGKNSFELRLLNLTKNIPQQAIITDLKVMLSGVKMHDKDLFTLNNIISSLEDTLK